MDIPFCDITLIVCKHYHCPQKNFGISQCVCALQLDEWQFPVPSGEKMQIHNFFTLKSALLC